MLTQKEMKILIRAARLLEDSVCFEEGDKDYQQAVRELWEMIGGTR